MGVLIADFTGLVTAPGVFSRGKGSCSELYNVSMGQPGVIKTRLGFDKSAGKTVGQLWSVKTDNALNNQVIAHRGGLTQGEELVYGDFTANPTLFLTVDSADVLAPASDYRMKMATALNRYVTSSTGPRRIEALDAVKPIRFAGMPRGLPADLANNAGAVYSVLAVSGTAAFNILADGYARNYRFTWHRYGENEELLSGPPTSRTLIHNATGTSGYSAAAAYVTLRVPLPTEWGCDSVALTDSYFVRCWATRTYNLGAGTPGGDECFLVQEIQVDATAISNGYAVFQDQTPDSFLITAPPLNTNTQNVPQGEEALNQGIDNADEPAPYVAFDLAYHQDCMWYARAQSRERVRCSLQTVIANGDTVDVTGSLGNKTYTANTVLAGLPADNFYVPTLTTLALSIDRQAANLANLVNRDFASTGIFCYHESSPFTEPGVLVFESPAGYGAPLVTFSNASSVRQENVLVGGSNQLRFSKPGRPDSCPEYRSLSVGSAINTITRIFPFRERLLVFTEEGIFQVTGRTEADFSVSPFDLSYRLLGPESVALADDRVYAHCYSGIVEIDDGGVRVISQPIENTLIDKLIDSNYGPTPFISYSFGVGYALKHEYRLFYQTAAVSALGAACDEWLAFDTRTRAWSKGFFNLDSLTDASYNQGRACGCVLESDRLALGSWNNSMSGSLADAYLCVETYNYIDFSAETASVGAAVYVQARFQFFNPNPDGQVHWQQTVLKFNSYGQSLQPIVSWYGSENLSSTYTCGLIYTPDLKLETPTEVRRSPRLSIKVSDQTGYQIDLAAIELKFDAPTSYAANSA